MHSSYREVETYAEAEIASAVAEAVIEGSYNDYPYPEAEAVPEGSYNDYPYPEAEGRLDR